MVLHKGKEMGEGERVVKGEMKRWRDREGGADIGEEREGKRSERGRRKRVKEEEGGGKRETPELLGHMLRSTEQTSVQCSFL